MDLLHCMCTNGARPQVAASCPPPALPRLPVVPAKSVASHLSVCAGRWSCRTVLSGHACRAARVSFARDFHSHTIHSVFSLQIKRASLSRFIRHAPIITPIDQRPAARSGAKKNPGRSSRPTDPRLPAGRPTTPGRGIRPTDPRCRPAGPPPPVGAPDRPTRRAQRGEEKSGSGRPTDRPSPRVGWDAEST